MRVLGNSETQMHFSIVSYWIILPHSRILRIGWYWYNVNDPVFIQYWNIPVSRTYFPQDYTMQACNQESPGQGGRADSASIKCLLCLLHVTKKISIHKMSALLAICYPPKKDHLIKILRSIFCNKVFQKMGGGVGLLFKEILPTEVVFLWKRVNFLDIRLLTNGSWFRAGHFVVVHMLFHAVLYTSVYIYV